MELLNFEELQNYKMSKLEKKIVDTLFQEYANANSHFEDMSQPEFDQFYYIFKIGWKLANIFSSQTG